jgi:hypothetical protein
MIYKKVLKDKIYKLLQYAEERDTIQGVVVYNAVLIDLELSQTDSEIQAIYNKLIVTLRGIKAHGYFTKSECKLVREIESMGNGPIE